MSVVNPDTGRPILRSGLTFRRMTDRRNGRFFYDEVSNSLIPFPVARVLSIIDPSDGANVIDRQHEEIIRTDGQYEAYEAALAGEPIVGLFRDPWYDRHAHTVEFDDGGTAIAVTVRPVDGAASGIVRRRTYPDLVRSDAPKKLPITNIDMNPGCDDRCVERWLGSEFGNVDGGGVSLRVIVSRASLLQRNVQLLDVYGEVIAQSLNFGMYPGPAQRAVLYQGHVYPFKDARRSTLDYVTEPVHRYPPGDPEALGAVIDLFPATNSAFWLKDGAYSFLDHGVFRREQQTEEWMHDFVRNLVPASASCWNIVMFRQFLNSTNALYTFADEVKDLTYEDLNSGEYMTLDMDKCYYNAALALGDPDLNAEFYGGIPIPDPFVQEISPWTGGILPLLDHGTNAWYVQLPPEIETRVHTELGLSVNVVSIQTWRQIVRLYNGDYDKVMPTRVWPFKGMPWPTGASEYMMATFSDEQKKKFAVVVGMLHDAVKVDTRELELPEEYVAERQHYARTWNMTAYPAMGIIVGRTERIYPRNHAHYRMAIVHAANALVIEKIVDLRILLGGTMPLIVRTDGLMYRRASFAGSDLSDLVPGWKVELKNKPVRMGRFALRDFDDLRYYRGSDLIQKYRQMNTVYTGAPGTGKTVAALRQPHDIIVTMTNRNAVRLGGRTIYSALGIRPSQEYRAFTRGVCERFRDQTVLVDEAQQFPRIWYSLFTVLFHDYGTRFIFTMDTNQLASIEDADAEGPICLIPFHGAHVNLTVDHRNDAALQVAREQVLAGTFSPLVAPGVFDPEDMALVNVCAHVLTREYVNAAIVDHLGLTFGDPGRYIVAPTNNNARAHARRLGLQQSQMLIVAPGNRWIFRDMEFPEKIYDCRTGEGQVAATSGAIKWGFAITTHCLIGSTIREPMQIWDWDSSFANNTHGLLYTAITRATRLEDVSFRNEPSQCRHARLRKRARESTTPLPAGT